MGQRTVASRESPLALEEVLTQRLERHFDPQLEVEGVPDLAHPTTAEQLQHLIALTQHLAWGDPSHPLRQVEGRALVLGAGGEVGVLHWNKPGSRFRT